MLKSNKLLFCSVLFYDMQSIELCSSCHLASLIDTNLDLWPFNALLIVPMHTFSRGIEGLFHIKWLITSNPQIALLSIF